MADDTEVFTLRISAILERNGEPFGEAITSSHQMTQTQAVIGQHLAIVSTQRTLMKLGIAAAMKKDPEFLARYNAAMAMIGAPAADVSA